MKNFLKKYRLHPLFIAYAVLLVVMGQGKMLFATVLAVGAHEVAHYLVARRRGYKLTDFRLTPLGAVLSFDVGVPDADLFFIAAAGPGINLFFSLVFVAAWWVFPSTYGYTVDLFYANLAIGCFNLLPLYPLDGSRIVTSFSKDKQKCVKILQILGYISSFLFAGLFIASLFIKVSYSLALVSVLLYLGAAFDAKNERYVLAMKKVFFLLDKDKPIEKKELYVHRKATVGSLLKALKNDALYTVKVVDDAFQTVKTISQKELENLFTRNRKERILP